MENGFEYKTMELLADPSVKFIDMLQSFGNEGWELERGPDRIDYNKVFLNLRRSNRQSAWEYHIFDTKPMPDSWPDHLGSCGWVKILPAYQDYGGYESCIFKRTSNWFGTDDGDVIKQLVINGWTINKQPYSSEMKEVVSKVLEYKWIYSEREGNNIGTYRAVKVFIENEKYSHGRY